MHFAGFSELFRGYGYPLIIAIAVSYLFGSINFAIIVTKAFKRNADIRKMGSGNAGFTNVLRSVGKIPAALVFIGDYGKGIIAVLVSRAIFDYAFGAPMQTVHFVAYVAGFCCIMGHLFPCFYGFRGGKGVLTSAAMVSVIDWRVLLVAGAIFLIVFLATRIVSLGSILMAVAYPIATFCFTYFIDHAGMNNKGYSIEYVVMVTVLAAGIGAIIIIRHAENIGRLFAGTEKKIKLKK